MRSSVRRGWPRCAGSLGWLQRGITHLVAAPADHSGADALACQRHLQRLNGHRVECLQAQGAAGWALPSPPGPGSHATQHVGPVAQHPAPIAHSKNPGSPPCPQHPLTRMRGYRLSGDSVPLVMTTLLNLLKMGFMAREASRQLHSHSGGAG